MLSPCAAGAIVCDGILEADGEAPEVMMPSRRRPFVLLSCVLMVAACVALAVAPADAADTWQGAMLGVAAGDAAGDVVLLDLVAAGYEIDIMGSVVFGTLVLTFENPSEEALKAQVAVASPNGIVIREIRCVDEAGVAFDSADERADRRSKSARQARRPGAGSSAQLGPAIVVPPGQTVVSRALFVLELPLRESRYSLTLPAMRTCSSAPTSRSAAARWDVDVPLELAISVHHDEPLYELTSPTHDVYASFDGLRSLVEVAGFVERTPFELEFALGSEDEPALMSFTGPETDGGREVVLVLTPPTRRPEQDSIREREVLFVVDSSGSMSRGKLDQARMAVNQVLSSLSSSTTYNIAQFDTVFTVFQPQSVMVSEHPVTEGQTWLARARVGGGTVPAPALKTILRQPLEAHRHRMVVILTDGIVSSEEEVLKLLKAELGEARLFVVGIGDDVRPDTIQAMAEYGRGTALFVRDPAQLATQLVELFDTVSAPLAWDLELKWGDVSVEQIRPSRIPDLYAGRPVTIRGRVSGVLPDNVELRARTMAGEQVFHTSLAAAPEVKRLVRADEQNR